MRAAGKELPAAPFSTLKGVSQFFGEPWFAPVGASFKFRKSRDIGGLSFGDVIYNDRIASLSRSNFTIANEFGHLLLHRLEFREASNARPVC
jgi:hypothetical protein